MQTFFLLVRLVVSALLTSIHFFIHSDFVTWIHLDLGGNRAFRTNMSERDTNTSDRDG